MPVQKPSIRCGRTSAERKIGLHTFSSIFHIQALRDDLNFTGKNGLGCVVAESTTCVFWLGVGRRLQGRPSFLYIWHHIQDLSFAVLCPRSFKCIHIPHTLPIPFPYSPYSSIHFGTDRFCVQKIILQTRPSTILRYYDVRYVIVAWVASPPEPHSSPPPLFPTLPFSSIETGIECTNGRAQIHDRPTEKSSCTFCEFGSATIGMAWK